MIYVDEMLNHISKWLRLFGIKTVYLRDMEDKKIKDIILQNKGILLTSDYELAKALKERALYLDRNKSLEENLAYIQKQLNLDYSLTHPLCVVCGSSLIKKDPGKEIPEKVLKNIKEFYFCPKCNKYYWKGKHWQNIKRVYENVKELSKSQALNHHEQ